MVTIRPTTDAVELATWRAEVIESVFGQKADGRLMNANLVYYLRHVAYGTHLAFIAAIDKEDAGCGAICLHEELPSPDNPSGRCAYLMNIYVRPQFRGSGLGRAIVSRLLAEARQRDCGKIYLETTTQARSLYHDLGFAPMEDMMKLIPQTDL